MTGQVDKIIEDRGFLFISGQDGKRYFLHATKVAAGTSFDDLTIDQMVEFEVEPSDKGPRATNARPANTGKQEG